MAGWLGFAPSADAQASALQGLEQYRHGNCKEAIPLFEQVLGREPNNIAVRKMVARCLVREGRQAEGAAQYRAVLGIAPQDAEASSALRPAVAKAAPVPAPTPEPVLSPAVKKPAAPPTERQLAGKQFEAAERDIAAGRLAEAERRLVEVQTTMPELALPRQRLAEVYIRNGQHGKAAEIFHALSAAPNAPPSYLLRAAQNYGWASDYPAAATLYRAYLDKKPRDAEARLAFAQVLFWSGQMENAAQEYRAYLIDHPRDLDARMNRGQALLWSKKTDEAIAEFEALAKLRPADVAVTVALAQGYEQASRMGEALAAYRAVLKLAPENRTATDSIDRMNSAALQASGFASIERKDFDAAARLFTEYLTKHPESQETVLQIARIYSWSKRYPEAARSYESYLKRAPRDETAIRELARVELGIPDFAAARVQYLKLAESKQATAEDYEGLVHAFVWDGRMEQAQPYARRLAELDPNSTTPFEVRKAYETERRRLALDSARSLTAEGRYGEALDAYRAHVERFGADREVELAMARIYSWDKQLPKAAQAYQEYLERYPLDRDARLELADIDKWSGKPGEAEKGYQQTLREDPKNSHALEGVAETAELQGADAVRVARAYREAIAVDPGNTAAREHLDRLVPQVSPTFEYRQRAFTDSDSFGRSLNSVEAGIPFGGGLRVTPFFHYDYFSQFRQVDGTLCGAASTETNALLLALSQRVCAANGTVRGHGGGARIAISPNSKFSFSSELTAIQFDTSRTSLQASGELAYHPTADRTLSLNYVRRDAVYDLNTIGSLFAGILGDTGLISYQQGIGARWRLWTSAGATRYSRGLDRESPSNTQRRLSARLDYEVIPGLSAGYFARISDFTQPSKLYFSPSYYGVYGFAWSIDQEVARHVRFLVEGDLGYGQVNRFDQTHLGTLEFSLFPSLSWRVRPDVAFKLGYRYGRGRSSAFGSPVYTTGALEFSFQTAFPQQSSRPDPARLNNR